MGQQREAGWWVFAPPVLAMAICFVGLWLHERRRDALARENERAAIDALKALAEAQSKFREYDKDANGSLDYATLAQLGSANLIDAELATGTKAGYLFQSGPSVLTSEFLWFATATPIAPRVTGDRYFQTNQASVIFFTTTGSFALNTTDCQVPTNAVCPGK